MTQRALLDRADRQGDDTELTAEDEFVVLALKQLAWGRRKNRETGKLEWKRIPKELVRRIRAFTPAQIKYWSEHSEIMAMVLQDRVMARAFGASDPRDIKLGLDAALDYKDRMRGKATEKLQVAQAVRVQVGGIDLDALPGGQVRVDVAQRVRPEGATSDGVPDDGGVTDG